MRDLEHWTAELKKSRKLVIVEGAKDKRALEACGIRNIATLSKYALYETAERIAARQREVVLLTDLDKEGKSLYGVLKKQLQRLGVKVDTRFREFLQQETTLSHIEGIHTYQEHVKRHGKKVMAR